MPFRMESPTKVDGRQREEEDRNPTPPSKKIRLGKVAEMVLVLSAMGKMRSGGVGPTDAEVGLMNEATEALAGVCEGFAPSEVFPKEAAGSVIDDLGLNRSKEQKPGPKLSIAERMLASKIKMEKADEFSLRTQSSQHWQGKFAAAVEVRNPSLMFCNQVPRPILIFPSGVPLTHGIMGLAISSPYQLPASEVRPVVYSASRAANAQTNAAPPSQSTKQFHASLSRTHSEIGKIVQKLLQPRVSERSQWVRPSMEYMSRPLACQLCRSNVTEIDSLLICDACEGGFHLKCLQTTSQQLPVGDWYCRKCLSLSNGKPLPPKYGRATRNVSTSRAVPTSSSKTVRAPN